MSDQHKFRYTDQWNTLQNPEIGPYIHSQLIFNKVVKTRQQKKGGRCWNNQISIRKKKKTKNKTESTLTLHNMQKLSQNI